MMAKNPPSNGTSDTHLPRVLVISNNCFSKTSNNGKTLASFFSDFPEDRLAQLYFSEEEPDYPHCQRYFRISDADVMAAVVRRRTTYRGESSTQHEGTPGSPDATTSWTRRFRNSDGVRLLREALWATRVWVSNDLDDWLADFDPEIIFFCAGDSGFAYSVTQHVRARSHARFAVYVTDDYVLPRRRLSPAWWVRRGLIKQLMARAVQTSDQFFTISPYMRDTYRELFGRDSHVVVNMTATLREKTPSRSETAPLTLVYAGGLHYNRDRTLRQIALTLRDLPRPASPEQDGLQIYSHQTLTKKTVASLTVPSASEFCGSVQGDSLRRVLNQAGILVHVESFDRRSAEATRLSISTKISEYLSIGRPILAVGPGNVASMQYLEDVAMCVTSLADLPHQLSRLIADQDLREDLAKRALARYARDHEPGRTREAFMARLVGPRGPSEATGRH